MHHKSIDTAFGLVTLNHNSDWSGIVDIHWTPEPTGDTKTVDFALPGELFVEVAKGIFGNALIEYIEQGNIFEHLVPSKGKPQQDTCAHPEACRGTTGQVNHSYCRICNR